MQIESKTNELERVMYGFWIDTRRDIVVLVFDCYRVETRATKRHKWVVKKGWSRLGYRTNSREFLGSRPELPLDIINQAKAELNKTLVVVEDYDAYIRR